MTKRQAAGGTLCLLFGQAFPLVYCAAERSKVEGPIGRALIYRTWKGSKVKSALAPSIKPERFPRPFLTHVLSSAALCRPGGTNTARK